MKKYLTTLIVIIMIIVTVLVAWLLLREPPIGTQTPASGGGSPTSQELMEQSGDPGKGGESKTNSDMLTPEQQRDLNKKLSEPPATD